MHSTPRSLGALLTLTAVVAVPLGLPTAAVATGPSQAVSASGASVKGDDERGRPTRSARVEPGALKGGTVTKLGWWSRSNEQIPETGLVAPPSMPAIAAPQGSYPVAQIAGESERIAAIEFRVKGPSGGVVKNLRLSLSEAADPAGSPNAAGASIVACTMTEVFWSEAENGPWGTRPSYDCGLGQALGTRDDKGVWSFDLTAVATSWLAEDREFAPAVVLLSAPVDEAAEPPAAAEQRASTYQVAFDATKGLGLVATTGAGSPEPEDPDETEGDPDETDGSGDDTDLGGGAGSFGGGGAVDGGVDAGGLGGGDLGAPVDGADPAVLDDAADGAVTTAGSPAQPALAPVSAGPLPWHAGIGGRVLLTVPALLLAYLVMLAMGPSGQPVVGGGRRGVSRALDRVSAARPLRFGRKSS